MPDTNPSAAAETEVTTPKSYDEQVSGLSNLLSDPDTPDPATVEVDDEAAPVDDDPDGLKEIGAEAVDEPTDDTDDPDGPDSTEVKGGRFAPDSAKVKLDNNETITIADLKGRVDKRVKEFQRDYTEKTTALKAKETEVGQFAQQLAQARDYMAWYAETHLPKQPGPAPDPTFDPVGYQQWQFERDKYNEHLQAWQFAQQQKQTETQRTSADTQQQTQQRLQREAETLKQTYPILKDPVKGPEFLTATARDANKYFGLTSEELRQTVQDHRLFDILRSAIKQKRNEEKAPQVKEDVAKRPAMRDGRRQGPAVQAQKQRQVVIERSRKSGSVEDAVARLSSLNL